jgi:dsDNA-specific endonuclease/ATPase MutS2
VRAYQFLKNHSLEKKNGLQISSGIDTLVIEGKGVDSLNNRFKHFFIKQKSEMAVIIQCLFETIDESVEEEAEAIFNVLFLSTRFDVILALENPAYVTPKFITLILNFARELKLNGRKTTIVNAPESLIRYLKRFEFDAIVEISND